MKNQLSRNLVFGSVAVAAVMLFVAAGKGQGQPPPTITVSKPYALTVRLGTEAKKDILLQEITLAEAEPFKVVTTVGEDTYTLSGKITASGNNKMLDLTTKWQQVGEKFPDGQVQNRSIGVNTQIVLEVSGGEKRMGGMNQPLPKDTKTNLAIYASLHPSKEN